MTGKDRKSLGYTMYPQGERLQGYPVQAADPPACPTPRQESDEYVCGKCRMRWDTHEDKPLCPKD